MELSKNININKYVIKLEKGKQPPYGLIYSLDVAKLEILKTYIEIYLKTEFIQPFKYPTKAFILFNQKLNSNFCLYIDYWSLNNLTIKNWYLILLIGELFD